ncbi:uncharacterized protein TNIN_458571 [Trichonephila inaurata madagascariensis]|uniref:Uncharacterized protein n=2 Tax=Trichonephila inaurata madagascariensis TaxID=2747483 RepID=A0A8X6XYZ3_9ARAC|nr:uncharacterized protein TNIN_458571 [Trichonephila inaurata madagascariensis]
MEVTCVAVAFMLMVTSTFGQTDVIYPVRYENQGLATRLYCQVQEPQHFLYSSTTDLWGIMGGQIVLNADVILLCLGDDKGGKYESEALKYRVEIANLQLKEQKDSQMEALIREKRGAKEFFSKSWKDVKEFFKRIFGRKTDQPEVTRATHDDSPNVKKQSPEPEPEEDLNMSDYISLYSAPFQFVQLANGSIPEIRFSENEIDTRVKNFKRHLVDAFSTQLSFNQKSKGVVEKSVIGEHRTDYNITVQGEKASLSSVDEEAEKPTVVVKKVVTEADILKLAPSAAVNDRQKMDLKLEQVQIFQEGKMVSSSGVTSLVLLPDSPKNTNNRIKREDTHDVVSYIQAHTTFDIQLQKRQRRSTGRAVRQDTDENENFFPASRMAEMEDHSRTWRLRFLPESDIDTAAIFESLLKQKDEDYEEKLQALFEIVEREVSLELDKENGSISNTAKKVLSKEVMQDLCLKDFSICKDFLQLLALVGGPETEEVSTFKNK